MARKLSPHEKLAFFQAAADTDVIFGRENPHFHQPLPTTGTTDRLAPEFLREDSNWDECLWPDDWRW